jgi:hypothetical protein
VGRSKLSVHPDADYFLFIIRYAAIVIPTRFKTTNTARTVPIEIDIISVAIGWRRFPASL